jgi:hypothetical protein
VAKNNVVDTSKINQAAGSNMDLRSTLYQIAKNLQLSSTVSNTASKNVPGESVAAVSLLGGSYIVQLTLPGTQSPASVLQGVQAAQVATQASNTVAITAVYNQIQAATTPRFDAGSNLHQYGGDTGSAQAYWSIDDLGSGQYYFRTRQSFDGVNWNLWKLANGGKPLGGRGESVTVEDVVNGVAAVFVLPAKETVAFVSGLCSNGGSYTLPDNLYTSAMMAIAGPNGFKDTGHPSHGIEQCDIKIQSAPASGLIGPPDFPTLVTMLYQDDSGNEWQGSANIFCFAFDPLGTNVSMVKTASADWAVFQLPGGGKLAVGAGNAADGATVALPAGFSMANAQAVTSPQSGFSSPNDAHGIESCSIDNTGLVSMTFQDGSGNVWPGVAQFLIFAYSPGLLLNAGFLEINTPGGSQVALGSGHAASGTRIALPAGYDWSKALVFAAPRTFNDTGHPMHGVSVCSADRGFLQLAYQDGEGNTWSGDISWMVFAWQ